MLQLQLAPNAGMLAAQQVNLKGQTIDVNDTYDLTICDGDRPGRVSASAIASHHRPRRPGSIYRRCPDRSGSSTRRAMASNGSLLSAA